MKATCYIQFVSSLMKALRGPRSSWSLKLPAADSVLRWDAALQSLVMEFLRQGYVESPVFKVRLQMEPASGLRALTMGDAVVSCRFPSLVPQVQSPLPNVVYATRPRDPRTGHLLACVFLFREGQIKGLSAREGDGVPMSAVGKVDQVRVRLWT